MGNLFLFSIPYLGFHFTLDFIFLLMSTELGAINLLFSENLRIQSEFGEIRTRKTSNTDTFYAVNFPKLAKDFRIVLPQISKYSAVISNKWNKKCVLSCAGLL